MNDDRLVQHQIDGCLAQRPGFNYPMRFFLTGVSCVGKSAIGRRMAELQDLRFFDMDEEVERFFGTSIERFQKRFLTLHTSIQEAAKALVHLLNRPDSRECVIALPPGGLIMGYYRVLKKTAGTKIVLRDKPENILARSCFYDIDTRLMDKKISPDEEPYYLKEIRGEIEYYRKSYKRADLSVDIAGLDVDQAARRVIEVARQAMQDSPGKPTGSS